MQSNQMIWSSTISILGVLFIFWGSLASSLPLIPGDIWLIFPGIIMLVLGLVSIVEIITFERKVRKVLATMQNDRITLDELSIRMNLQKDDLRELLLELRFKGKINFHFDVNTGEIVLTEERSEQTCKRCGELIENVDYCSVCGEKQIVNTK